MNVVGKNAVFNNIKIGVFGFFILVVIYSVISIFSFTKAMGIDVDEQRQAVLETAYAYYRQGEQLQYDSYRKNLYSTPEDATSCHYTYTVCSGFTFQVYYQALGLRIPDTTATLLNYAKVNKSNKENIIFYYGSSSEIYSDEVLGTQEKANYSNLIKEWSKVLQPGDVIVVTGHSMLVESVDIDKGTITLLESAYGTRYDYDEHVDLYDSKGTIKYTDLSNKLKTYYNKIKNDKTLIEEMAVIRFITDGTNYINRNNEKEIYSIKDSAKSRLKYPKIDIEKTSKIHNNNGDDSQNILVDNLEYITYEIIIKNSSNINYSSFDVVENIDSRLLVANRGNGKLESNKLKWTISSLEPSESVTLSYTVQVPNDRSLLGKVIVSSGSVDSIATSKIEMLVGNKLSDYENEALINSFNKLKTNSQDEREFINAVYLDAFDIDLGLTGLSNLDIMSYDSTITTSGLDSLSVKKARLNDTVVKKYIYNNFYGLRLAEKDNAQLSVVRAILNWNYYPNLELNDRARTITSDMLIDGDVVLVYLGNDSTTDKNLVDKSYIYLNNKLIRKISSSEFEELSGDALTKFLRDIVGENYIILRPSIAMINEDDVDNSVDNNEEEGNNDKPLDDDNIDFDNDDELTNDSNEDNVDEVVENIKTGESFIIGILLISIGSIICFMYVWKNKNIMN